VNLLVAAIRVAGAIQVLDIAANLALPRTGSMFCWSWGSLELPAYGSFGPELAGGRGLGRFLSGVLAIFWLLRAGIQVFYFDADLRKQNRLGDLTFAVSALYMGVVFTIAALRPLL
jgi:hypothetical protein